MGKLSAEQISEYQTQGFTKVGRILDDQQLAAMRDEEVRLREKAAAIGRSDKQGTIFISQVCHLSQAVRNLCIDGAQVDFATELVGDNLCLWFNQYVTKLPDKNTGKSAFPWHQDNGYGSVEPPDNVTFWVALSDVDESNGCIWVKPGSHKLGLLQHRTVSAETWHLEVDVPGKEVPVPLKAGEAIAFTGLTVHSSKLNHTDQLRPAFFMEYAGADARLGKFNIPVVSSQHSWIVRGQSTTWIPIGAVPGQDSESAAYA